MKKAVFVFKTNADEPAEYDLEVLNAIGALFEAFGCEVFSELYYEDVEDEDGKETD